MLSSHRLFAPIACLALLAACEVEAPPDEEDPDRDARVVVSPTGPTGDVVDGNSAFAWGMYDNLAAEPGNLFFSPFSISAALSMTLAGAEADTETEMASVLGVANESAWHPALGALINDLNGAHNRGYTLHVANRIFGQQDYPFETDFLAVCEDDYGAPLESVDYGDPETARTTVNTWVEDQTNDRIEDLLPSGSVTVDTRLVLANAIYFLGDWAEQFDPANTREDTFRLADGSSVQTDLMWQTDADYELSWFTGGSAIRLPYQDDEVSMIVMLPDEDDGLPALEARLAAEFEDWVDGLNPSEVTLALPKLEMSWELELSTALKALGMPLAFDAGLADFSGIAGGLEPLWIDGVYHKAFVSIDEVGTEAAAATGVVITTESAPPSFVVDHPYLFVIRDDLTGSVLFVGRVEDPTAG